MAHKVKILTGYITDDREDIASLEKNVEKLRERHVAKVTWLQSSANEGTKDGSAMFTVLTAIVEWREEDEKS